MRCSENCRMSAIGMPAQPVDATQALNLSAGVSNCKVYGRNATDRISKTLVVRIKAKDQPVMTEVKHN